MSQQDSDSLASIVSKIFNERHSKKDFLPGTTQIPVTGKVFGEEEITAAVEASLDFWLTSGPYSEKFESEFAKFAV